MHARSPSIRTAEGANVAYVLGQETRLGNITWFHRIDVMRFPLGLVAAAPLST